MVSYDFRCQQNKLWQDYCLIYNHEPLNGLCVTVTFNKNQFSIVKTYVRTSRQNSDQNFWVKE